MNEPALLAALAYQNLLWLVDGATPVHIGLLQTGSHLGPGAWASLTPGVAPCRLPVEGVGVGGGGIDTLIIAGLEGHLTEGSTSLTDLLFRCKVCLAPGGRLIATGRNAAWVGRQPVGSPAEAWSMTDVRRSLERAGFTRCSVYYLQAYPGPIHAAVPAWAPAAAAYERLQMPTPGWGRLRSLVARFGGHRLLYPGFMMIGYV